ncbi:MAG: cache domain-containing protein [Butyrivibrio sp.]|nr:cache domain-containing protein [Butyrivibrio sp.]
MLKRLNSLKIKFPLISFFTYLALVVVILAACYMRFSYTMKESYIDHGEEILNLAAEDIVIDHIPDYLSGNYDVAEYEESVRKLDLYPKYFDEVFYLYAYQLKDDGVNATYLFDASVDHDEPYHLGDNYELEADIRAQIVKHGAGNPLDSVTDNTQWGYLLTCSKPLLDSKGNFQGYLLVDIDLTKLRAENQLFIFRLFGIAFALMLVVFALGMQAVAVRITTPIEKLYLCLSKFRYATVKDREENLHSLQ